MNKEHYVMNGKLRWLLIGLLLVSLAMPVLAVDYSGEMTYTSPITQTAYTYTAPWNGDTRLISGMLIKDIETYTTLKFVYMERETALVTCDAGVTSWAEPVDLYVGAQQVGTGLFGFNRNDATAKVNVYLNIYTWDVTGLAGSQTVTFVGSSYFNTYGLRNLTHTIRYTAANGYVVFNMGGWISSGVYSITSQEIKTNYWTMTESGSAVTIDVTKYSNTSLLRVYNGTSIVDQEPTSNTNAYTITTIQKPLKIMMTTLTGHIVNTSEYYSGAVGTYSIIVNPPTITTTGSATGEITPTYSLDMLKITDITWEWSDTTGTYGFFDTGNTSRPLMYSKIAGTWYGYDSSPGVTAFIINKGTSIPNPVVLSNITSTGQKLVKCYIATSDGNFYTLTTSLTVGGAGAGEYITTKATMIDFLTGNRIKYGTIAFQNIGSGAWTNQSPTSDGTVSVSSSPITMWNIYGNATGYTSEHLLGKPSTNTATYGLFMYPLANITAANNATVLYVTVEDAITLAGISGAGVGVSSIGDQSYYQFAYTSNGGMATFYVPNSSSYWISAQKTGYEGAVGAVTIALQPMISYHLALSKPVVTYLPTTAVPTIVGQPGVTAPISQIPGGREAAITASWDVVVGHLQGLVTMGVWAIYFTLFWIMIAAMTGHIPGIGGKLFGGSRRKK